MGLATLKVACPKDKKIIVKSQEPTPTVQNK